ncbi:MAG: MoxR family ATPase [Methanomicrobiales archaeon]|nr:MoxR family ATPase [Methanomicrobiales archaeon]MDD1655417.1 MoxR family ATPase [Methanomicrobiales archaeon]
METPPTDDIRDDLSVVSTMYQQILGKIGEFVVGNESMIEMLIIGLLAEGHVLIEGVPGTAKTTLVKVLSHLSGCEFKRVQCAVDTQPADILGIRIFDQEKREFLLKKGPIFSNFTLIDEINRITPKTQSAFIEAMSERQVTIDGITFPLPEPFFCIATQNPFEYEGTFPLIEAQKDRFMMSYQLNYLSKDEEMEILRREERGELDLEKWFHNLQPILDSQQIARLIRILRTVYVSEPILEYIRDLVVATRSHGDVMLGASSRASIGLVRGGRAVAAMNSRTYVIPDDIKKLVPWVMEHRLVMKRESDMGGVTGRQVLEEILRTIEVP